MEWKRFQATLCSGCGQPKDETMDPHGPDYEPNILRCWACEIREDAGDKFMKDGGSAHGLYVGVSKVD